MASKVSAARLAACGGVPVLLASAADISGALSDAHVGTAFHPANGRRLSAWKFWALYAAEVAGTLRIDAGAVTAVTSGGRSLLPIGIQSCEGEFHPGDIVEIMGPDGADYRARRNQLQPQRPCQHAGTPDERPAC